MSINCIILNYDSIYKPNRDISLRLKFARNIKVKPIFFLQ